MATVTDSLLADADTRPLSYQDVVAKDKIPPPPDMREQSQITFEFNTVDKRIYLDAEFHQREMELMWSRVWQFACREEEIPEVGDVTVYEIGDYSFIIVRSGEQTIKGYYNSCRHRGQKLCLGDTSVRQLRCPYHGFAWSLDGTLEEVPCRWDFPHLDSEEARLLEVRVATWGGFIFINMDPNAAPLEEYLEILPEHLAGNRYENKYIAGHSQHILPANWKNVMESFMEGFHAPETHAHAWPHLSDTLQYDVYQNVRHVNRSLHAVGIQTRAGHDPLSEQEIINHFHNNVHLGRPPVDPPTLPAGVSARGYMADIMRMQETLQTGHNYTRVSDAEALDVLQYSLFPNMILFRGISLPPVLRFRPNKNDHNSCIFDLFYLVDVPKGKPRPDPARTIKMAPDDTYQHAGVLPDWLGYIYDQDMHNIKNIQAGLRAGGDSRLILSEYHESRIKHFHATLAEYVSK